MDDKQCVCIFSASELRCFHGKEPAAAGHITGRAAEVGQQAGQKDPQEAPGD